MHGVAPAATWWMTAQVTLLSSRLLLHFDRGARPASTWSASSRLTTHLLCLCAGMLPGRLWRGTPELKLGNMQSLSMHPEVEQWNGNQGLLFCGSPPQMMSWTRTAMVVTAIAAR